MSGETQGEAVRQADGGRKVMDMSQRQAGASSEVEEASAEDVTADDGAIIGVAEEVTIVAEEKWRTAVDRIAERDRELLNRLAR